MSGLDLRPARRTALQAALCLLAAALCPARPSDLLRPDGTALAAEEIDRIVLALIRRARVAGAGLALFHEGGIGHLKAYGVRDSDKGLPLTEDSVMTAASLSKAAFATVVMRLVAENALDLDRPIQQYLPQPLPEYARYADLKGDERWKRLTLRILLSHSSGLPNWRAYEDDHRLRFHFDPGTRFAYSGEGIDLAQQVVETVTGRPLEDLMQEKLLRPLQMTRTSMLWQQAFEGDFASGYDEAGRPLGPQRRTRADAAGSMQTTLHDYATFLAALLSGRILDARAAREMLRVQIRIHSAHQFPTLRTDSTAAYEGIGLGYGIGWGLYTSPRGPAFFKEGHDEGWRHLALLFPAHGDGILILTNSANGEGIFKPLIDALLGPVGFPFEWEGYTPYDQLPPPAGQR
jgi:CubicO group peptidase (beta-lactamase class C family)